MLGGEGSDQKVADTLVGDVGDVRGVPFFDNGRFQEGTNIFFSWVLGCGVRRNKRGGILVCSVVLRCSSYMRVHKGETYVEVPGG